LVEDFLSQIEVSSNKKEISDSLKNEIEKDPDQFDWKEISEFYILPEEFISLYKNKVVWHLIIREQKLSEKFIEDHLSYIDMYYLCVCQNLSEDFIEKYKEEIKWEIICLRWNLLSEEFIRKNIKYCIDYINDIVEYQDVSELFIEDYKSYIYYGWTGINKYRKLSKQFIINNIDNIDYKYILKNENISKDIKDEIKLSLIKNIDL